MNFIKRIKEEFMQKHKNSIFLWVVVFVLAAGVLCMAQERRQRPPWDERSPKVNKTVPDLKIYDENLNHIPFSNLYKDTLLIVQWGGCT
jgi:hypothetical protein